MKHLALLLILFLVIPPSFAADVAACGDAVATRFTTYTLVDDLVQTGATPCLSITAGTNTTTPADVVIDCDGHSITFDGFAINMGDRDNVEVLNCTFNAATVGTQGAYRALDGADDSASGWSIHDNVFNLAPTATPEPYGLIVSNKASDDVEFYNNTCNLGGTFKSTCMEFTGAGAKTNWYVHHNNIVVTGTPTDRTTGIGMIGGTSIDVSYNTIQVNDPLTIGDADQVQSISCYKCITPNLHHNTITEYGTHGRVFSVDNVQGGSIHHNTITLNGDGSGGNMQGIGMRGDTIGVEVYQNVIDARGCTFGCGPMWMGNDTNPGELTYPGGNLIHDNWIYVDGPETMTAFSATDAWDPDNRFWNNTISCEDDSHCWEFSPQDTEQLDAEIAFTAFLNTSSLDTISSRDADLVHDIDFCQSTVNGSPLSSADVDDIDSSLPAGEPGFTTSPCLCETEDLGCGPTVGARSEAAAVTLEGSFSLTGAVSF